jgi:hypothetical protein
MVWRMVRWILGQLMCRRCSRSCRHRNRCYGLSRSGRSTFMAK